MDKQIIDGSKSDSLVQFVNHSCTEPNCRLEEWIVGSKRCVGLFTNKALNRGTILTINYHAYDVSIVQLFECLCGSTQCRRIIGPGFPLRSNTYITIETRAVIEWGYGRKRLRQIPLHEIVVGINKAEENGRDLITSLLHSKDKALLLRKLRGAVSQVNTERINSKGDTLKVSRALLIPF